MWRDLFVYKHGFLAYLPRHRGIVTKGLCGLAMRIMMILIIFCNRLCTYLSEVAGSRYSCVW
jgi:hypothetical protein